MKRITPAAFYRIALAIGNSNDLQKSSSEFLKELVVQTNSKYACFYIYNKHLPNQVKVSSSVTLISAYPEDTEHIQFDAGNITIPEIFTDQAFLSFQYDSEEISRLPDFYPEDKDDHIIIPVKELGFIQLVSASAKKSFLQKKESIFETEDSENLGLLISKFSKSIVQFLSVSGIVKTNSIDNVISGFSRKADVRDNDFLKRMLATISHEIRNPFNLALGYTELLKETPLNEAQRNYVN
ncbi:MAG: hypothetical protein HGA37_08205, partial [Lentimicrobium sp.]|nr:hypothetical protein [Lentimicrobium sp.]